MQHSCFQKWIEFIFSDKCSTKYVRPSPFSFSVSFSYFYLIDCRYTLTDIINSKTCGNYGTVLEFLKSHDNTTITNTSGYEPCVRFLTAKRKIGDTIEEFMKNNSVDLLVYPYDNQLPPHVNGNDPPRTSFLTALLSSSSGLPSVNVPMGLVDGVPIGLTALGKRNSEKDLVQFAFSYDNLMKTRVPPALAKV